MRRNDEPSTSSPQLALEPALKQRAAELGFHLVGIASAEPFAAAEARTLGWLNRGYQAEMGWMNEQRTRLACNPQELLPGARSIISVGVSYFSDDAPATSHPDPPLQGRRGKSRVRRLPDDSGPTGRIARYAWGDDYHGVMRKRLWELVDFLAERLGERPRARVFVDSSPFPDREAAVRAGLGFYGKNTTLLTGPLGSFLFLGAILTDVPLEPDRPQIKDCGQCRLCLDACPTGALAQPYELDSSRCISYLTIELRGVIPSELRRAMGDHLFGCDICQDVCPWNKRLPPLAWPEYRARPTVGACPDLAPLLELDERGFRELFRNSAVLRTKRRGFLRNVAVVLGNSGDRGVVGPLAMSLADSEALIRAHAAWALGKLGGPEARAALEAALEREPDDRVRQEILAALDCRD